MTTLKDLECQIESDALRSFGDALAGACAGAAALTLLFPLDTVKTRHTTKSGRIYTYQGMMSDLIHLRNIDDLYRGYRIGLMEVILFQGIHFFFYSLLKEDYYKRNIDNYKNLSKNELPQMPALQSVGRGCIAGLMTQLLTTPFGVVKARLQTSDTNETIWDVMKSIYEEDGITGFWRGMKTSVILIINPVIVFFVFERLQRILESRFGKGFWTTFITGGLSKCFAGIICHPLTFIKTNLQAAQKSKSRMSEFRSRRTTQPLRSSNGKNRKKNTNNRNKNNNNNNSTAMNSINEEEISSPIFSSHNNNNNKNNNNNSNAAGNGITRETETDEDRQQVQFDSELEIIDEKGNDYSVPLTRIDESERTQSMSALVKYTLKKDGISGLYQGLGPKLLHATLMYAIIFSCKEKFTYYTFFLLILITQRKNPKKFAQKMKVPQ